MAALFLAALGLPFDLPFADFAGAAPSAAGLAFLGLRAGRLGSGKALAIESDFSNPDCGKRLAMPVNLLVLLLPLEVEDQDLIRAAAFHDLAADHGPCARPDGAFLAETARTSLNSMVSPLAARQLLNFHNVAGCDAVLLSPGANNRVHNSLHRPFKALAQKDLN